MYLVKIGPVPTGFQATERLSVIEPERHESYWADPVDLTKALPATDPLAVWVEGDYHLMSQAGRWDPISRTWLKNPMTSPCIDAGDPDSPIGPEPSPNGDRINMGVYGGTTQAGMSTGDG